MRSFFLSWKVFSVHRLRGVRLILRNATRRRYDGGNQAHLLLRTPMNNPD